MNATMLRVESPDEKTSATPPYIPFPLEESLCAPQEGKPSLHPTKPIPATPLKGHLETFHKQPKVYTDISTKAVHGIVWGKAGFQRRLSPTDSAQDWQDNAILEEVVAENKLVEIPNYFGGTYEKHTILHASRTHTLSRMPYDTFIVVLDKPSMISYTIAYGDAYFVSGGIQFLTSLPRDAEHSPELSWRSNPLSFLLHILPQLHIHQGVEDFCLRHRLFDALSIALYMVKRYFPTAHEARLQVEEDPETEEAKLVLDITIQGEIDEVLASYDAYTSQWVTTVPWPQRDHFRLSYDII